MRLRHYLTEADFNTDKVVSMIKKDCGPFLNEISKVRRPLWRGSKTSKGDFAKVKTRTDRLPLDTGIEVHKLLDAMFYRKFGWPARSQSVICTNTFTEAAIYGNIYTIYPIGKFDVIWAKDLSDVGHIIPFWADNMVKNPIKAAKDYNSWPEHVKKYGKIQIEGATADDISWQLTTVFDKIMENELRYFIKGNLSRALKSNMNIEIMVKCDEYYLVSHGKTSLMLRELWK
jgi:hypothetical protein